MLSYLLMCGSYVIMMHVVCCVHRLNFESNSLNVIHRSLSSSTVLLKSLHPHKEPKIWPLYNDVVYPPSLPNEPLRPAVSGICSVYCV